MTGLILTLTMDPAVDVHTELDQVVPNRKLRGSEPVREAGGGGVNVARAVRRLGGEAAAVLPAGGLMGDRLRGLLADEGIASLIVPIAAETRETFTVNERSTGNQFRFVAEGPSLTSAEASAVLDAVRSFRPAPEILVASGTLPRGVSDDFYGQLSAFAAASKIRLIVDTSGMALRHAVGPGTFLLKPNLSEFRELAGTVFSDFFLEGAAHALVSAGKAGAIVVSLGAGGAIYASERGTVRLPAPTVKIESRAGAGDSMVAGIATALVRGWSLDDAVVYGIAAGSAAVMNPGTELCRLEDVERLYTELRRGA